MTGWIVDCAGARMGGAARFLNELDGYLAEQSRDDIQVVGRTQSLTPQWLVEREFRARGGSKRVALNNVGFMGGARRIVLLRNALHFSTSDELASVDFAPSPRLLAETQVVRAAARRASLVVVPCTDMKERVLRYLPSLEDRIVVRFHPVTPLARQTSQETAENRILVPVLPAPYKRLDHHAQALAAVETDTAVKFAFTASAEDLPSVAHDDRFEFLGRQSATELAREWNRARAIYFPTAIESFGYPLAEARALGRRIIALDTDQNREIAGAALAGFVADDQASLSSAVLDALSRPVAADPAPFDRRSYFDWLLPA